MTKRYYYIANWKMYWSYIETISFVTQHCESFLLLSENQNSSIILCPSATALQSLAEKFKNTNIALGGQDCSENIKGAFTGQISAQNLKSTGARFCIIGHSERRKYNHETNNLVAAKLQRLLEVGITPIICIGETLEQNKEGKTLEVLREQLAPVLHALEVFQMPATQAPHPDKAPSAISKGQSHILIAYEPVWAIGTGLIPTTEQLEIVFAWLAKARKSSNWSLIYGGSTASSNISQLKSITLIDGFLIGGASLDFQEFEKIVKYNGQAPETQPTPRLRRAGK